MTTYAGQWGPETFVQLNPVTHALVIPTSAVVYARGTTTAQTCYANRTRTAGANPLPTGVTVGAPGIDTLGNIIFIANPGSYDLLVNGTTRYPIEVYPDPAEPVAAHLTDLTDVDPAITPTGDGVLGYLAATGKYGWRANADPGSAYVPNTALGANNGVATLDGSGKVVQGLVDPQVQVKDTGGAALASRSFLDFYGFTVTDDSAGDRVQITSRLPNGGIFTVASDVTNSTNSMVTLTDWDLTVPAGKKYTFAFDVWWDSTLAAQAKFQIVSTAGWTLLWKANGPSISAGTEDDTSSQTYPTNHWFSNDPLGASTPHFGGFPDSTLRMRGVTGRGRVVNPTGSSGVVHFKFGQAQSTPAVATAVRAGSELIWREV